MFMLTKTHTAAVKSLSDDLEEARDEIAKLKGARRIDGITVKDLEGKFKKAVRDLADEADVIEAVREHLRQPETPRKSRLWEIVGNNDKPVAAKVKRGAK